MRMELGLQFDDYNVVHSVNVKRVKCLLFKRVKSVRTTLSENYSQNK